MSSMSSKPHPSLTDQGGQHQGCRLSTAANMDRKEQKLGNKNEETSRKATATTTTTSTTVPNSQSNKAAVDKTEYNNPFEQAVRNYGHLLEHNYDNDMVERRFGCLEIILEALVETLLQKTSRQSQNPLQELDHILFRCCKSFGVAIVDSNQNHEQFRNKLLNVVERLSVEQPRQQSCFREAVQLKILEFLPMTFLEEEEEERTARQLWKTFRIVVKYHEKSPSAGHHVVVAFLKCLASLPSVDLVLENVTKYIESKLEDESFDHYPAFVGCLLDFCWTESLADRAISCIRRSWGKRLAQTNEDCETLFGCFAETFHAIVSSGDDNEQDLPNDEKSTVDAQEEEDTDPNVYFSNHLIQEAFIKALEGIGQATKECNTLDVAFVLYRYSIQQDTAHILKSWIATHQFPFDALNWLCQQTLLWNPGSDDATRNSDIVEAIRESLIQSLRDLTISLVTDVNWTSSNTGLSASTMAEPTIKFVVFMCKHQPNLVEALIQRWSFTVSQVETDPEEAFLLPQLGSVLQELANRNDTTMLQFSHIFTPLLCCHNHRPLPGYDSCVNTCCKVLSHCPNVNLACLVQKLLFSFHESHVLLRGLLLATQAFQSGVARDNEKISIKNSVLRVVLPPNRKMVEPELGPACLAFLRALIGASEPDVFKDFQMLVSNTGLIQSLSHYNSKQNGNSRNPSVLGFRKSPKDLLQATGTGKTSDDTARLMVFCVEYFGRSVEAFSAEKFASTTRWVFELVDAYLEMGRKRTSLKWKVSGWLSACIAMPKLMCSFPATNKQQKAAVAWLQREFRIFELCLGDERGVSTEDVRSNLTELFSQDKFNVDRILRSLYQTSLGLCIAVGVCAAVVKNAFEHYKAIPDEEESKQELLHQIGVHLLKVNAIRQKCDSVDIVLFALDAAVRRQTKDVSRSSCNSKDEGTSASSEKISKLREILSFIRKQVFLSPTYFAPDVLWQCLNDGAHSILLQRNLASLCKSQKWSQHDSLHVASILNFKHQLATQLLHYPLVHEHSDEHLPECIQSAVYFIGILPRLKDIMSSVLFQEGSVSLMSISNMASTYLYLAISSLSQNFELRAGEVHSHRLQGILQTDRDHADRAQDLSKNVPKLLDLLKTCDDLSLASGLLELISFTLHEHNQEVATALVEASLELFCNLNYATQGNASGKCFVPFAVRSMALSLKSPATEVTAVQKILRQTVCKCAETATTKLEHNLDLQRTLLLRHFGFLCHSKSRQMLFKEHTDQLCASLLSVLSTLAKGKDKQKSSQKPAAGSDKKRSQSTRTISAYCLNKSNFAGYFETLLHIAVGGFSVFDPEVSTTHPQANPYKIVIDAATLFRTLIQNYATNLESFPRRSAFTVFQASRSLLDVLPIRVGRCIEWRSFRKVSQQEFDAGSLENLQSLIDELASNICGGLKQLCNRWIQLEDVSNIHQKGRNLQLAIEKAMVFLKDVAVRHKLSLPRLDSNTRTKKTSNSAIIVGKPVGTKKTHNFLETRRRKKRRISATILSSTKPEDDNEMDTRKKFAATGNWGLGDDDTEEEEEEEGATPEKLQIHFSA